MKSRYKFILIIMLLLSGALVVVKNSLDERDITALNSDVEAMYQDRLMAANYIYRMNDLLHKKRAFYADAVTAGKETIERPLLQQEIRELMTLYAGTSLTKEEEKTFFHFRKLARQ